MGSGSDGNPHHRSGGLETCGGIHRVAGREPFAGARIDVEPDECLTRVHTDPDFDPEIRGLDVVDDPKGSPHCSLGIVLMSERHAEDPDDRISDELLHHTAVGLDAFPTHRLVLVEEA